MNSQQQDSIVYKRPQREIRRHARFVDTMAYTLLLVDDCVFFTYRKVVSSPESVQ